MYDSSSGGADFVLRVRERKKIIIEIGFGKEDDRIKQVENTSKIIGGYNYSIVISRKGNLKL